MRAVFFILLISLPFYMMGNQTDNPDSNCNIKLALKSDFMSQHLWRGYAMCDVPSIEPSAELAYRFFKSGVWAALSLDGNYFEIDAYLKYSYKGFSLGIYDYYCPGSISSKQSFFNYKQYSTKHTIDLHFEYEGNKTIPFRAMLATMVYGDDINNKTNQQYYSTYFELGYFLSIEKINVDYFLGFNIFESYYGKKPSIINSGIKISGKTNVLKKQQIPLQAVITYNPLDSQIYLVFGFTI